MQDSGLLLPHMFDLFGYYLAFRYHRRHSASHHWEKACIRGNPRAHRQWLLSARPHISTKSGSVFDFPQPPTTGTQRPHLALKKLKAFYPAPNTGTSLCSSFLFWSYPPYKSPFQGQNWHLTLSWLLGTLMIISDMGNLIFSLQSTWLLFYKYKNWGSY